MNLFQHTLHQFRSQPRGWLAGALACVAIALLYLSGSLTFIERQLSAGRFELLRADPSGDVVVVAIDARSLQNLAVWPWPRSWHASVVDSLVKASAKQIVIDVDFSAKSNPAEDAALAAALARAGERAVLPVFEQSATSGTNGDVVSTAPLELFLRHTRVASVNVTADADGVVRKVSRVALWKGNLVPSMASVIAGTDSTRTGRFIVDFGIRSDRIPTISYVDVLEGNYTPDFFAGKSVLVGATARELGDTVATPVDGVAPGVILQALAAESLIQHRELYRMSNGPTLAVALLLFWVLVGVYHRYGWARGLATGVGAVCLILVVPLITQATLRLTLDSAPWLAAVAAAFLVNVLSRLRTLDLRVLGQAIALRRSDALMRQVVENSYDGLLVVDEHGKVRSANSAAERMLGQRAGEIVGQHFFDLIATTNHQPPIHGLARMAYADKPSQIALMRPDGTTLIADVALTRIPDNPSAAYVALLHDVTEMKMREAELRTARDQAEAASNSKSQFLANMSHELRTPLNAVIGFSEIMKGELLGPIGTESYRGYSHSIHDSAKHLLSIINDILDISSIESGNPRLHEGIHEPEAICQSVIALVSGRAETARVTIAVSVDPATDLLFADGRMVKQMLINLLGNAIKFSPAGGTVDLKVTPAGPEPHSGIVLAVIDRGIGIAKADIPRILKPFEQVETAYARNFDGVGLGLPLVNSMARLHGATLSIESELNLGTTVSILFPAMRTRPRVAEADLALAESGAARIRAAE